MRILSAICSLFVLGASARADVAPPGDCVDIHLSSGFWPGEWSVFNLSVKVPSNIDVVRLFGHSGRTSHVRFKLGRMGGTAICFELIERG